MNVAMGAENQSLQHDNKQLNTLIKEYEQTLDTLMSAFRTKAVSDNHNISLYFLSSGAFCSATCKSTNYRLCETTRQNCSCGRRKP
jgi:prefoldin subunit 5